MSAKNGGIHKTRIMKRMVTNKKNSSLKIMRNGQVTIFLCVLRKMFLTAAEASCRLNDDKGARLMLNSLMQKRDEDYTCKKTGTALGKLTSDETGSLLEEIIINAVLNFGENLDVSMIYVV